MGLRIVMETKMKIVDDAFCRPQIPKWEPLHQVGFTSFPYQIIKFRIFLVLFEEVEYFQCPNDEINLPPYRVCDGDADCRHGEDEGPAMCGSFRFQHFIAIEWSTKQST